MADGNLRALMPGSGHRRSMLRAAPLAIALLVAGCLSTPSPTPPQATPAAVVTEATCFLVDGPASGDGKIPLVGEVWHDGTLADSKGALVLVTTGAGEKHYWDGDFTGIGAENASTLPRVLAAAGYAVMPYDRLGQGESPYAGDDRLVTADINARHAASVVGAVRAGSYALGKECDGGPGPAMGRVVLGGHSIGALITMAAATQHGGVDGVLVMQFTHYLNPVKVHIVARCLAQSAASDPLGESLTLFCPGQQGYSPECIEFTTYLPGSTQEAAEIFCANDAIHPEPRGMAGAFVSDYVASEPAPVGGVPMHFVFGDRDCATNLGEDCVDTSGNEREVADWSAQCNCDVTSTTLPDTGHDYVVHHNQWMVGQDVLAWLDATA